MRKILHSLWRGIIFPFRLLWRLLTSPLKLVIRIHHFLTDEPEDRSLTDAFADTLSQPASIFEHIDALRKHLFRMLIALAVGVAISATFTTEIIAFLARPIGGIDFLQAIEVTETVGVFMRVALLGGFTIAIPYLAFELWLFTAPGLHARARRIGLVSLPLALLFFISGIAFAYVFMLPVALPFLINFMGIQTIPRIASYINFVTGLLFWIGISFEYPLVIYILSLMGVVKPGMLARQWRVAIVAIAVLAGVITPTVDPVNMALVMAPMIVLYFFSIGLSYLALLGRKRRASGQASGGDS
ncbi:MAG: twin-arginine translocase subunit TatC [Chloroflexota bacterium]